MGTARASLLVALLLSCGAPPPPPKLPVIATPRAPVESPLVVAPLPPAPERLPHTFEPTSYAARLHVDPTQPGFSGTIEITGQLTVASAVIWLSGEQLVISRVVASRDAMRVRMVADLLPRGVLALRSEQPLDAGTWTLSITYSGTWDGDHAVGGTRQKLRTDHYVYTQFEPDYARRVFPCFDEPDRKVRWRLTLDVPDAMVAASNTLIESETRSGGAHGTKTVRFAPTLPLPSYLVAFAVGPFDVVDAGKTTAGVPIRILTMRGDAARAAHAAATAAPQVDKIERWLGVPFPYPKLDIVTVPGTEPWWYAMENAGLITIHREALADPKKWDSTVSHEIAHHWFGDLVTLAWWDEIWLNESFAYWVAHKLGGDTDPDPPVADQPLVVATQGSPRPDLGSNLYFQSSSSVGVHKGRRFLEVLEATLGESQLVLALRSYLTAHAHSTVHSSDLRSALVDVGGADIGTLFDRYAYSPTEPLELELTCGANARRVEAKGFGTTGLLCVAYDHDGTRKQQCGRLEWGRNAIELSSKRCPRWVFANAPHDVKWSRSQLEALRDHGWPSLTDTERRSLLGFVLQHDPSRGLLRLSYIDKTAASMDEQLASWVGGYLLMLDAQVPPALRSRYDLWIRKLYSTRVRAFGIAPVEADKFAVANMQSLMFLVMNARDPGLIADALALKPKLDKLAGPARVLVMRAAIADTPSYADELIAEVPKANVDRKSDIVYAVETVPDLLDFMLRHAAEIKLLADHHKLRLLSRVCDAARRTDVEKLGHEIFPAWSEFLLRDYEWCIQERKALEPELRAFLDGATAAPKRSQLRH